MKTMLFFAYLIFSTTIYGQAFLGRTYESVLKELESNKIEHRIEKFDNERLSITAFSQYDVYVDQVNEVYYFLKETIK